MKTEATPALLQNEQRDEKSAPTESPDRARPRCQGHEALRAEEADRVEATLEAVPVAELAVDVAHQVAAANLRGKSLPAIGRRGGLHCWGNCFALGGGLPIGW